MENPNGNNVAVNQVVVVAVVLDDQVVEIQDIAQANQPNLGGWRRARLQGCPVDPGEELEDWTELTTRINCDNNYYKLL